MPASTKKVTKPTAKRTAKATTKVLDKPKATRNAPKLLTKLINKPFEDVRNAKPAKASEKPAATGAKAKILDMIAAKGGTSAAEVCKALGWVRAGATIGRAIKLAGFKVAKARDADGVLRYSAEG